jgi:hypothetical protein
LLEEGTPWANKAELYIGISKEAVCKDMKASNCPLPLWDYCVGRRVRINNMTAKDRFNLHGSNTAIIEKAVQSFRLIVRYLVESWVQLRVLEMKWHNGC